MQRSFCLLIALCAVAVGCDSAGPKTYKVSGTASVDGTLIEKGDIKFVPEDPHQAAEGGRIEAGRFSLQARAGKNKVQITASKPTGQKRKNAMGEDADVMVEYIPAKYNQQTTLSEDIQSSRSDLKFELSSK